MSNRSGMKGSFIIISSPSGGGKGTLIREVMITMPDIGYSVSYTTRAPRFGEEHGREYFFISQAEFDDLIAGGDLLEYAEVHGNMYGTSRSQTEAMLEQGRDVILEIDVQGALNVMEKVPDVVSIFILPPSYEVLEARLTARNTEDAEGLALRLRNAVNEVAQYERFQYVIVNDVVTTASRTLGSIISAERQKRIRQNASIQGILDSFARAKHTFAGDNHT